jgi:hypothetical protein
MLQSSYYILVVNKAMHGHPVVVNKAAKKAERKVNHRGQQWTDDCLAWTNVRLEVKRAANGKITAMI